MNSLLFVKLFNIIGDEHPDVAETYDNIGATFCSRNNFDRALEYHEKALNIKMRVLGSKDDYVQVMIVIIMMMMTLMKIMMMMVIL